MVLVPPRRSTRVQIMLSSRFSTGTSPSARMWSQPEPSTVPDRVASRKSRSTFSRSIMDTGREKNWGRMIKFTARSSAWVGSTSWDTFWLRNSRSPRRR